LKLLSPGKGFRIVFQIKIGNPRLLEPCTPTKTPPSIDGGEITKPNQRGHPYLGRAGAKTSGQH